MLSSVVAPGQVETNMPNMTDTAPMVGDGSTPKERPTMSRGGDGSGRYRESVFHRSGDPMFASWKRWRWLRRLAVIRAAAEYSCFLRAPIRAVGGGVPLGYRESTGIARSRPNPRGQRAMASLQGRPVSDSAAARPRRPGASRHGRRLNLSGNRRRSRHVSIKWPVIASTWSPVDAIFRSACRSIGFRRPFLAFDGIPSGGRRSERERAPADRGV